MRVPHVERGGCNGYGLGIDPGLYGLFSDGLVT